MRVRAFAKINRSLEVVGVRADGFHELRTVFQSIALHDTLAIRRTRGPFVLDCRDPQCPTDRTNLIWRAADAAWKAAGRRGAVRGVAITLTKRIPIAAGLGGGSSDAAATIRALGAWWRVPRHRQIAIAAALGADVPFFFEGGAALGLDRGDILYALEDPPPAWVVLVVPSFGVSTKEAYGWFDADHRAGRASRAAPAIGDRRNDLEAPVARRHPEIARIVRLLRRAGAAHAAMSGSGSAVFGEFSSRAAADAAAAAARRPAYRVWVTRTLSRRRFRVLAAN